MHMDFNKEKIYNVLKYSYNGTDSWIYSTIKNNNIDESHKYFLLTIKDGYPTIMDVENPIDTLKQMQSKPISIKNDPYEYMKFIAMKNLAEKDIKELKMSHH